MDIAPLAIAGLGGAALGVALAQPFDLYLWANAVMLLAFSAMSLCSTRPSPLRCRGCGHHDGRLLPDGSCWWCADPRPRPARPAVRNVA